MAHTREPIAHEDLLAHIKENLEELRALLTEVSDEWVYEDKMYRFHHHSFKVYSLQDRTHAEGRPHEDRLTGGVFEIQVNSFSDLS